MRRSLVVALLTLPAFFAERASAQTVSAQGSGIVAGSSDCLTCVPQVMSSGGKGVSFGFSFSGTVTTDPSAVAVTGTFNAVDKETNISLTYSRPAVLSPHSHTLCFPAVDACLLTTAGSPPLPAACSFCAVDNSSNGRADEITFFGTALIPTPEGDIFGCGGFSVCPPIASGNMHID